MEYIPTSELLEEELKQIAQRVSKCPNGYASGYPDLDQSLSGGFQAGYLYCLGGTNSMGKTMVALNIVVKQLMNIAPKQVLVFVSTGTSQPVLIQKLLAIGLGIELSNIQSGELSKEEVVRLGTHPFIEKLKANHLVIIENKMPSLDDIESIIYDLIKDGMDPKMLFIDHIQDMRVETSMNREQGVYRLLKSIKVMALQVKVPVLFTSKVSKRVHYRKESQIPMLFDLLDSRLIGDACDYCFMVIRPNFYQTPGEADYETLIEELHLVCRQNKYLPLDIVRFATDLKKHLILNAPKYNTDNQTSNL